MSNSKKIGSPQLDKSFLLAALKNLPGCAYIPLHKPSDTRKRFGVMKSLAKVPLHKNWTTREYNPAKVIEWCAKHGHNLGIRLSKNILVIDGDPRNYDKAANGKSVDGYMNVCDAAELDCDAGPRNITGGGGLHVLYYVPDDKRMDSVRQTLEGDDNKGVEFKYGSGAQILAPGSRHESGKLYTVSKDHADITEGLPPKLPTTLRNKLVRPKSEGVKGGGQYSQDQIAKALSVLDPTDFREHSDWLRLMMACHHASSGDARSEFVEWSASDPQYAADADNIGRRWDSLHAERNDGVTYRTLNKILSDKGFPDLMAANEVGDDEFDDELPGDDFDFDAPADNDDDDGMSAPEEVPDFVSALTPYVPTDPAKFPMREWLYGSYYIRKFVGLTVATGGAGKSSLILVECIAMATGKALLGIEPVRKLRVFYWNGEDPQEEIERRTLAILKYYGLTAADLGDRLILKSGRDLRIKLAQQKSGTTVIKKTLVEEIVRAIETRKIDVAAIDPFVSSHAVAENDNGAIEMVAKEWADIAERTNCHIHISHHTRKSNGNGASIEDSRGASSLNYAARTRRSISTMTAKEAEAVKIEGNARFAYFKADTAGSSMTKPAESLEWYRFESVDLGNNPKTDKIGGPLPGDNVGVVCKWEFVALATVLDDRDANGVLKALKDKGPWRADQQSAKWLGFAIGDELGVTLIGEKGKRTLSPEDRLHIKGQIAEWLKNGILETFKDKGENRQEKEFIRFAGDCDFSDSPDGDEIDFG